jgi:type VI secretion system ImpM family protein
VTAKLFGKLPAHGDFVARGMSAAERDGLDAWLSASLADARAKFEELFDEIYDYAQPWAGAGPGVVGAIAASQDAAGRRFPVLLLCAHGDPVALIGDAIAERWDADRLVEAAGDAPGGDIERWWTDDCERLGPQPSDLIAALIGDRA